MRRNRGNYLRLASAFCGLALCAALLMPIAAPAHPSADTQTEKSTKAKRSKKSTTVDASQGNVPESKSKAPAPTKNASPAEIQSAKSSGEVWVNTDTGVYHKSGKWYGATKNGKFMPEQEAVKSGFRAAKNEK
jgi:hypothetical protein